MNWIYAQLSDKFGRVSRKIWRNKKERRNLKNLNFTVFSQNCIGGIMYHDLGLQFRSPTVNMLFEPKDFIKFIKNIDFYLKENIEFIESDKSYPIGYLGDILIKFLHYHTQEEVIRAWSDRMNRINWNNVFILCCDEGLELEDMIAYDKIPYKNKILFLHKEVPEITCGVVSKDFDDKTDARLLNFVNIFGKRYYQNCIDYVKWLNGSKDFQI